MPYQPGALPGHLLRTPRVRDARPYAPPCPAGAPPAGTSNRTACGHNNIDRGVPTAGNRFKWFKWFKWFNRVALSSG